MTAPLRIKVCGLNSPEAVAAARDASDHGFIFFPPSPRCVSPERAAELAECGSARRVAVMVDPNDALVDGVMRTLAPDVLQLHGRETAERAVALRRRFDVRIMKALRVSGPGDVAAARDWEGVADAVLFDARPPPSALLPGGNGQSFDWSLLAGFRSTLVWFLSGGLDAGNVQEALRTVSPGGVDVSSGVEDRPGVKNPEKIRAFVRAVRQAGPAG